MHFQFKVLGLNPNSNPEEIKKAYHKLALKNHPDKNPKNAEAAKEAFQKIQQAHEKLTDVHPKNKYSTNTDSYKYPFTNVNSDPNNPKNKYSSYTDSYSDPNNPKSKYSTYTDSTWYSDPNKNRGSFTYEEVMQILRDNGFNNTNSFTKTWGGGVKPSLTRIPIGIPTLTWILIQSGMYGPRKFTLAIGQNKMTKMRWLRFQWFPSKMNVYNPRKFKNSKL